MFLSQRQSCASTPPTPANTSSTATAPTSSATTSWRRRMMVRMGRTRKPGMAAFYNATAENASPLAVAGPFVAGQRGAGAGQLCEAAVRAYGAAMGSVCTCSRCKEWDLQQDPVRAVHNFYSDTNPGVSEACDTNKTTPSCVCQPGSKVYYRECV